MPKKASVMGRGGAPPMMRKGGRTVPKFGVGGDVGRAIGDWIQGRLGFKRGGKPVPKFGVGGDVGRAIGDWIQGRLGFKRGGRPKK